MDLVSIIIVNYNGRQFLEKCIGSVLAQTYGNFELIIVENGSSDGSNEYIKNNFKDTRIVLVESKVNLGFAGGNNLGYRSAKGKYIALLNNDTIVENNWLEQLVSCISADDKTGIVQSLVYTEGIPERYYRKNGTVNLLGHNIMEMFEIGEDGIGEIFQASGCSMIIRKDITDGYGYLFPEEYFAYAEDTFLSFRVKFSGYDIKHNANSVVHHAGNATFKKFRSSYLFFFQERNRILNILLFFNVFFQIRYIPYLMFNFLMKFFASFFIKKYSVAGLIKAYFWIIFNTGWILRKRKEMKAHYTVQQNYVLGYITSRLFNGASTAEKIINAISYLYCKITFVRVLENRR